MNRKKRFVGIWLLFCCSLCLTGCQSESKEDTGIKRQLFAMDTVMDLTAYGKKAEQAIEQAAKLINRFDRLFSVTNKQSDIYKLNHAGGKAIVVEKETYDIIQTSIKYSEETDGALDISIYPLVKAWGFTTEHFQVPSDKERNEAMKKVNYKKIHCLANSRVQLEKGMEIDLGALAKGYTSQKVMECWKKLGVTSGIISLGGNVQTIGKKTDGSEYQVGITNPADGTSLFGALTVVDRAVVTSGIYQRNFTQDGVLYHHIMNRKTGKPADNTLASVTVIASDGTQADALATSLFVMGEKEAKKYQKNHPDIQILLIRKDGTFWHSDNLSNLTVDS